MIAKPIAHTISSSSSQCGYHNYLAETLCPRKARLDAKAREEGETGLEKKTGFSVGIIGHAYLQLHFTRALGAQDPKVVRFSDVVDEEARCEAERCVRAFIQTHPNPEIFGKVLGVEETIEPGNEAIEEAVGISPYSARLDLRTKMSAKDVSYLQKHFKVEGTGKLEPGNWIVDNKFLAKKDGYLVERYMQSHQAASYNLAADAKYGCKHKGTIFNIIFKYKEPDFMLIVVPPPSERLVKSLHTLYEHAAWMFENRPDQAVPSENNCFSYSSPCRWWLEGVCPRY